MTTSKITQVLASFRDHVSELAATWYEGSEAKAFRHAAFQQVVDPNMADAQVIESTAIDKADDLEIDGWFLDDMAESSCCFKVSVVSPGLRKGRLPSSGKLLLRRSILSASKSQRISH